jgi:glycosyltransferase involved in cell wall biosynthesis
VSSIRGRNSDKRAWQFLVGRRTVSWSDRVIFNSRNVVPFAVKHEGVRPEQVVFIPNGIPRTEPPDAAVAAAVRAELGLAADEAVVGAVGRLFAPKNHAGLLQAFRRVVDVKPRTRLLVVGDGPLRGALHAQARRLGLEDRVRFVGHRRDVPRMLACMDVYVQSSVREGMPNARGGDGRGRHAGVGHAG